MGVGLLACGGGGANGAAGAKDGGSTDAAATQEVGPNGPDSGEVRSADGGETEPDGASPADAAAPVTPTVSSWLGTNIAADLPRVDVAYQLTPFNTAAAQLDANGYPVAGASGTSSTDIGFVLPTGTYKISFQGTGSLCRLGHRRARRRALAIGPTASSETRCRSPVPPENSFGNFLTLKITNAPLDRRFREFTFSIRASTTTRPSLFCRSSSRS